MVEDILDRLGINPHLYPELGTVRVSFVTYLIYGTHTT